MHLSLVECLFQFHTTLATNQLRALHILDAHLSTRTFFVGERITLADITVATSVQQAASVTIDAPLRAQLPNLIRHLETVINQPQFKDVFQPTQYIEKALQYVPPKKEKEKAKPAVPPKVAKAVEMDEEDEPAVPPQPKAHNPLDDLPKSSFNLEDWKRAYSNMDTRGAGGAIEWFYEQYVEYGVIKLLTNADVTASTKRDSPFGVWTSSTTRNLRRRTCRRIRSQDSSTALRRHGSMASAPSACSV